MEKFWKAKFPTVTFQLVRVLWLVFGHGKVLKFGSDFPVQTLYTALRSVLQHVYRPFDLGYTLPTTSGVEYGFVGAVLRSAILKCHSAMNCFYSPFQNYRRGVPRQKPLCQHLYHIKSVITLCIIFSKLGVCYPIV